MENQDTPRKAWLEVVRLVAELDPKLTLAAVGRQLREARTATINAQRQGEEQA